MFQKNINFKSSALKFLLTVVGLVIPVMIAELSIRILNPQLETRGLKEMWWLRENANFMKNYTLEPEFGFRPILGGNLYNKYGTKVNNYSLEKKPGVTRILCMGDSVTAKGTIINGFKKLYGETEYEYWNAGVESFNTIQEVNFYKKHNAQINPDHVILFFHNNDFESTPVAFLNKNNQIVIFCLYAPTFSINRQLYQTSYLYRFLCTLILTKSYAQKYSGYKINDRVVKEIEASLKDLKNILAKKNIRFTVVVLPLIKNYNQWLVGEKESHAKIIEILKKLNIHYIDLLAVTKLLESKVKNIEGEFSDGGYWHPKKKLGFYFAKFMFENSFLMGGGS